MVFVAFYCLSLLSVSFIVIIRTMLTGGADPGCLSRNLSFVHPQSWIPNPGSGIPDPKIATKETGERICYPRYLFCSHKNNKTENYIILNW
jgi:hypothetical protein